MLLEILKSLGPAIIGIFGGWLAGRYSARAALDSWRRSRKDSADTLAVQAIKDLATELARAAHYACWITWKAKYDPSRLQDADIERYDAEMHESLPKLLGAQAALASIDGRSADSTEKAVETLCSLDVSIGEACVKWRDGDKNALPKTVRVETSTVRIIRNASAIVLGDGTSPPTDPSTLSAAHPQLKLETK
jgi:hypothetical protein